MLHTRFVRRTAALVTAPARLGLRALGAVLRRRAPESAPPPRGPVPFVAAAPRAVVPSPASPLLPSELPIASYDALNARDAIAAVKELTEPADLRTVLRYEEENAKRTTVHRAARAHLEWIESGAAVLP